MTKIRLIDVIILTLFCVVACKEYPKELPPLTGDSGDTIIVNPTPEPPTNPLCNEGQFAGEQPFVWKPESENVQFFCDPPRRVAVVLLPSRFVAEFDSVSIGTDEARFTGFANGGRQHWRFCKKGEEFGRNFQVVAREAKQECSFTIRNGARRQQGE